MRHGYNTTTQGRGRAGFRCINTLYPWRH